MKLNSITPFLWFDGQAEAAAEFYASVFPGGTWNVGFRTGDGAALVATFTIRGIEFSALNGGPHYKMTPGTSFLVDCKDQEEVDYFWEKLSEGGETLACGWLTDKFGVTWQIVPTRFFELLDSGTAAQTAAVMATMQSMIKLELGPLEAAFAAAS